MDLAQRRIVIVGAGLAGAATAWHLRRAGAERVLLLERERVAGMHASGRNAAMLRERMDHAALQDLAHESADVLRGQELAGLRRTGGLLVGLGREDVSAHVPCARGRAAWCPGDGVVDVAALLQRYLAGAEVRWGCALRSFESRAGGLRVRTDDGDLDCDTLVNAAGAWAGVLGDLDLTPRNRHLFVSAADAAIDPDWPFVWDPAGGYYLRPESGGWLLCACDETPAAPGDYAYRPEVLEDLAGKLHAHQPGLGDLRIAHRWVGQRTFASDGLPVVGWDPGVRGLFHVAALGGHGVTLSWSVGRLAAQVLAGRRAPPPALDPARLSAPTARASS
jgi:D-arginine dehydrogenase